MTTQSLERQLHNVREILSPSIKSARYRQRYWEQYTDPGLYPLMLRNQDKDLIKTAKVLGIKEEDQ